MRKLSHALVDAFEFDARLFIMRVSQIQLRQPFLAMTLTVPLLVALVVLFVVMLAQR